MFSYSSPFASWIEKTSGVWKWRRASGLSSSRHHQHGELRRLPGLLVQLLLGRVGVGSTTTVPASAATASTRKLLSRSIEPKRGA